MHGKSLEHEMEKGKPIFRHCEERGDEAIQFHGTELDCFAALAMTRPLLQQRVEDERSFLTLRRDRAALRIEAGFHRGIFRRAGDRFAVGRGQLRARGRGRCGRSGRQLQRSIAPAAGERQNGDANGGERDTRTKTDQGELPTPQKA
jgi:hypothetical protein